jgi:ribosome-binding ATPase YchF (GTP1/OBG family)
MKIGLVGYQGSGKSTVFHWLTGCPPDPGAVRSGQSASVPIPEPRLEQLRELYQPKKVTPATLDLVDTPGLSRTHEGNAARLAIIREADCLVLVIAAFDRCDPAADWRSFEEDLLLADIEVVLGRISRVEAGLKKPLPRAEHEQLERELHGLREVLAAMEQGKPLRQSEMSEEQLRATRAFRLLTEKPRMIFFNTRDSTGVAPEWTAGLPAEIPVVAAPAALELELAQLSPEERQEFATAYALDVHLRDRILRQMMDAAGWLTFFTVSPKEVKAWLLRKGGTALEAADTIHSDMARGFIRAEVMKVSDLVRLGGEKEVRAQHLVRHEPKDYVVHDDDVLYIRFSA